MPDCFSDRPSVSVHSEVFAKYINGKLQRMDCPQCLQRIFAGRLRCTIPTFIVLFCFVSTKASTPLEKSRLLFRPLPFFDLFELIPKSCEVSPGANLYVTLPKDSITVALIAMTGAFAVAFVAYSAIIPTEQFPLESILNRRRTMHAIENSISSHRPYIKRSFTIPERYRPRSILGRLQFAPRQVYNARTDICSKIGAPKVVQGNSTVIHTFGTDRPEVYLKMISDDAKDTTSKCSCPCGHHSPPFVSARKKSKCTSSLQQNGSGSQVLREDLFSSWSFKNSSSIATFTSASISFSAAVSEIRETSNHTLTTSVLNSPTLMQGMTNTIWDNIQNENRSAPVPTSWNTNATFTTVPFDGITVVGTSSNRCHLEKDGTPKLASHTDCIIPLQDPFELMEEGRANAIFGCSSGCKENQRTCLRLNFDTSELPTTTTTMIATSAGVGLCGFSVAALVPATQREEDRFSFHMKTPFQLR